MLTQSFYRKLKRDLQAELTEASIPGAALSVVAAVVMLGLIFAELNSFLTVSAGIFFLCTFFLPNAFLVAWCSDLLVRLVLSDIGFVSDFRVKGQFGPLRQRRRGHTTN